MFFEYFIETNTLPKTLIKLLMASSNSTFSEEPILHNFLTKAVVQDDTSKELLENETIGEHLYSLFNFDRILGDELVCQR